jgi:hypothetical protein
VHRDLLRSLRGSGESFWIIEDDTAFDVGRDELLHYVSAFLSDPGFDVLCLSHLTPHKPLALSAQFAISVSTYTTACYLVKPWAIAALEESFTESLIMPSLGIPRQRAGIDVHWWKLLQTKLVFCIPRNPIAHQVPSFSDIEGTHVGRFKKL